LPVIILLILSNPLETYSADPYEIFKQADSTLSAISTVEYNYSFSGTQALSNIIPVIEGTTQLGFVPELQHPLMRHSLETTTRAISSITIPSISAVSADSVYFVNNSDSVVYRELYTAGGTRFFSFPPASVMMEFVVPDPFIDEILADSIAVLYPVELDSVWCHVFHVFYKGDSGGEAVWFLGMEDLLPRAVERIDRYGRNSLPGGELLELSGINTGCSLPDPPEIPEGFQVLVLSSLLEPHTSAPDFFLADTDGFTVRSTQFRGSDLLVCFFSSWDHNSLSALGLLKTVSSEFPEAVQAVGISILETSDPLFRLNALDLNFPVLVFGEDAAADYNVHSVPALFLVSSEGIILYSSSQITQDTPGRIMVLVEESIQKREP
jgi:peroxiredoxin